MHASHLRESHLEVLIEGGDASVADLLPEWTVSDRVGVVVHGPLGALGASLLIQAATSRFYAFDGEIAQRSTPPYSCSMSEVVSGTTVHWTSGPLAGRCSSMIPTIHTRCSVLSETGASLGCWCRKE